MRKFKALVRDQNPVLSTVPNANLRFSHVSKHIVNSSNPALTFIVRQIFPCPA